MKGYEFCVFLTQINSRTMDSLEEQLFAAVSRGDTNCVNCLLAQGRWI
jgi:hypothetical protein